MTAPQFRYNPLTNRLDLSDTAGGGGDVTSVEGTAPIQVNGVSGVPQTGVVVVSTTQTDLHIARFIVSAGGTADGANYTTIASAYAAAVSAGGNQTVFIQPGTYTENITLSANINLSAFSCDAQTPNVTILGKLTGTFSGSMSISGINLKTNSDFCLAVTGSSATVINLINCFIDANNNSAMQLSSSNSGSAIKIYDCVGNIDTTGIGYFSLSGAGFITFTGGYFRNDGVSTTASTVSSSGELNFYNTFFNAPITTSSTSTFTSISTQLYAEIIIGGTGNNLIFNSYIGGGNSPAISVSAGSTLKLYESSVDSTNTNAITGAGTLIYGGVSFVNTSSTINTTTQLPQPFPVVQGGTGNSSIAAYAPIIGGTTSTDPFQAANTGQSNSGYVWTSNGAGAAPSFQAGGGIVTIDVDSGSITGSTVTISGGTTGLTTSGSSATMDLTGTLKLANGGTNADLTASDGGIFYSSATAAAILAGTATANKLLMSGASTTPAWSTSTYPATNAANTLLYASSANTMAALATADSAILNTSASGVPSLATSPVVSGTISAVSGYVGNTTTPSAGNIGEQITSGALSTSLSNSSITALGSINLTAGIWDISALFSPSNTTEAMTDAEAMISTTSASFTGFSTGVNYTQIATAGNNTALSLCIPALRVTISATTTYYLNVRDIFSGGTNTGNGVIRATRVA